MHVQGIFLAPVTVILLLLPCIDGCGRGSITIQNNGYKDILIAIGENTPDTPALVDRIKAVFTEASAFLYTATRKRTFFEEIKILVPSSWTGAYSRAGKETFDKSDIVIDIPDDRFGQGNRPFVIKTTGCGEAGHYMHLTVDFIMNATIAAVFGPYNKILVHEWAHLRYGVYDEYQVDYPGAKHFYAASPDGNIEAIRCGTSIKGSRYNVVSGVTDCKLVSGFPEPDCRYQEQLPTGTTGYASIMYKVNLDAVTEFCDNDPSQPLTLHDREAPHYQNRYCNSRSVWEVLREHEDFSNGSNPAREITNTTPSFSVIQRKAIRNVLVLDRSGSMTGRLIQALGQGCSNYITDIIQNDELLGVVWFNAVGTTIANLTVINNTTRLDMLNYIPTVATGGTSVGGGIDKALLMLEQHDPSDIGGNLIVVTDGKENASPYISDVLPRVIAAQVTVHTIAITTNADPKLDLLSAQTNGLSFVYSGGTNSNAINEAFLTIGELNINPTDRSYVLKSESQSLPGNGIINGSTLIDNTLGRETQLLFDYSSGDITPVVTSPSGTVYSKSSTSVVKQDTSFGIYRFTIPQAEFQSGRWQYTITSQTSSSIRVAVTVKSKSATPGQYPIVSTVHWGKKTIASVGLGSNNPKQSIYASVSKGYAPVLNAAVVATVESIKTSSSVQVSLLDNGAGADIRAGDGIYTAYFLNFDSQGRYGLSVKVDSSPVTVVSPRRIIGYGVPNPVYTPPVADESVDPFQRISVGGSFTLEDQPPSGKLYPPGQILDLSVVSVSYDNQTVTITWTAVGDQLDQGQASKYELRLGTSFSEMENNFSNQTLVTEDMVVSGNNLTSPKPAGEIETFVIMVPTKGTISYVFAVKAVDTENRTVSGPQSNIATASLQNFNQPQPPPSESISLALLMSLIAGGVAVLAVFIATTVVICVKKMTRVPQETPLNKPVQYTRNEERNQYTNIAMDNTYESNAYYTSIQNEPSRQQAYMGNRGMQYMYGKPQQLQNPVYRY